MKYIKVTSGSSCIRVTSKAECEEAARQLGLSDTLATEEEKSNWPPHCYFNKEKSLYYNKRSDSARDCNSHTRTCICKDEAYLDRCQYATNQNSLSSTGPLHMREKRTHSAAVSYQNSLWISGGWNGSNNIRSTEFVHVQNGQSVSGTDLPIGLWGHAMVAINATTYLLIGGCGDHSCPSNRTFYHTPGQPWRSGPDLQFGRHWHTAGLITATDTFKNYVVVVGGVEAMQSVEILDLETNQWHPGRELPFGRGIYGHQMVGIEASLVVLGGYDGSETQKRVYRLTCSTGTRCTWRELDELKHPRKFFTAMTIPDSFSMASLELTCE